jgi:hypothetical protein
VISPRSDRNDRLAPSSWSVTEARDMVADLRHVATQDEYDALELFAALCSHLDELYGGYGFTRLLDAPARATVADLVRRIRGGVPTGSPTLDDNCVPVDLTGRDADRYFDGVVRLDQPVDSAYTPSEGRQVAAALAAPATQDPDSWQGELGRALQGLYHYLDELYGGPGAFTELLNSEDRRQVARLVESLLRR